MQWVYWPLMVAYAVTILSVVVVILSENRNPVKSLAWVTVLLLLPAVGLILYIFFGRSFKNKRMISRNNRRRLKRQEFPRESSTALSRLSAENRQIVRLATSLVHSIYSTGNSIDIFTNGQDKFQSLINDIRAARFYIHIQYYIFEDDRIGHEIKDLLIQKAKEGVTVRVIYDHVGSIRVKKSFFTAMKEAGIMVYPFFRVAFPPFGSRINWRNHRKIVVIDGTIGYIGGMNIADRYITGGKFKSWRDTHLRISGPAASSLQYSFAVDWAFMGQPLIEEQSGELPPQQDEQPSAGIQVITSGPVSQWNNIALVFLKAIHTARKRVFIQTPYFLPTESMLKALQSAALSGVDVRVMIPRQPDSALLKYGSYSYIQECLRSGIKFYLYEAGMMHSKTLIIDNDFASVGSTNFDFRSFEHNFEGNVLIYSKEVNARLRAMFDNDLNNCSRINATAWRHRSLLEKILESIVRLLSPIL